MAGHRKRRSWSTRSRVGIAGAVLLVAAATTAVAVRPWAASATGDSTATPSAPGKAASSRTLAACPDADKLNVAQGDAKLAEELLHAQELASGATCRAFALGQDPSAPASMTWTTARSALPNAADPATWIASDEVVLAGQPGSTNALGFSAQLTTESLRAAVIPTAQTPLGQASPFVVVADDPKTSPRDVAGVAALLRLAAGGSLPAGLNYTSNAPEDVAVIKVANSLLPSAQADQANPASVALRISTSAAAGLARQPAVSLGDQTRPMIGLVISGTSQRVTDLRAYLLSTDGQAVLLANGFHAAGKPAAAVTMTIEEAGAVAAFFAGATVRFSTLAVLDSSWSMTEPLAGGATSKLDIVKQLAVQAYALASPSARSGLWTFNTAPGGPVVAINKVTPLARNDTAESGTTHAMVAVAGAQAMTAGGGTPLYQAIQESYAAAVENYQPGMVNQLLVMTDGINEDSNSTVTLDQLVASLNAATTPDRPVRLVLIALDPGKSWDTVQRIAAATGGTALRAADVSEVPGVFKQAIFGQ